MQEWIFQEDSLTLSVILAVFVIEMACILLLPSARGTRLIQLAEI